MSEHPDSLTTEQTTGARTAKLEARIRELETELATVRQTVTGYSRVLMAVHNCLVVAIKADEPLTPTADRSGT